MDFHKNCKESFVFIHLCLRNIKINSWCHKFYYQEPVNNCGGAGQTEMTKLKLQTNLNRTKIFLISNNFFCLFFIRVEALLKRLENAHEKNNM